MESENLLMALGWYYVSQSWCLIYWLLQENILINVTAGALEDTQESNNLQVECTQFLDSKQLPIWQNCYLLFQITLNISVSEEEVLVNDVPVQLSGVTRFNCQALLCKSTSHQNHVLSPPWTLMPLIDLFCQWIAPMEAGSMKAGTWCQPLPGLWWLRTDSLVTWKNWWPCRCLVKSLSWRANRYTSYNMKVVNVLWILSTIVFVLCFTCR